MTLIASSTATGTVANFDFTSIPATYKDLQLFLSLRTNSNSLSDQTFISFNGSTANFGALLLYGNGSTADSASIGRYTIPNGNTDLTASTFSSGSIYIPNYAGATNKSYSADGVNENNAAGAVIVSTAGLWSNTAAINQITLTPNAGSYVIYSSAYLYGVKNA